MRQRDKPPNAVLHTLAGRTLELGDPSPLYPQLPHRPVTKHAPSFRSDLLSALCVQSFLVNLVDLCHPLCEVLKRESTALELIVTIHPLICLRENRHNKGTIPQYPLIVFHAVVTRLPHLLHRFPSTQTPDKATSHQLRASALIDSLSEVFASRWKALHHLIGGENGHGWVKMPTHNRLFWWRAGDRRGDLSCQCGLCCPEIVNGVRSRESLRDEPPQGRLIAQALA